MRQLTPISALRYDIWKVRVRVTTERRQDLHFSRFKSPADLAPGDSRGYLPRFSEENFPFSLALVAQFDAVAAKYNATASQIALAWILAKYVDMVPIPGSRNVARLEENAGGAKIVLKEEDMQTLNDAVATADVRGARKPAMPDYFSNTDCIPLSKWNGE